MQTHIFKKLILAGFMLGICGITQAAAKTNKIANTKSQALLNAVKAGDLKKVCVWLKIGAPPNKTNEIDDSPLVLASYAGHTKIVKILLDARARHDISDGFAGTPLHIAASQGHTEVVQLLLAANACPDKRRSFGGTPLHEAAGDGHAEVVQILLAANACPDKPNYLDITPLHTAASKGHAEVVHIMINDYRNKLITQCPIITKIEIRKPTCLLEKTLPVETAQLIAEWLTPQDIISLRSASTHCQIYTSHEFEKIRQKRAEECKKKLIAYIQHAKTYASKLELFHGRERTIGLLQQKLKNAEQLDLLALPTQPAQTTDSDHDSTECIYNSSAQNTIATSTATLSGDEDTPGEVLQLNSYMIPARAPAEIPMPMQYTQNRHRKKKSMCCMIV